LNNKSFEINRNKQSTDSNNLEAGRGRLWISARVLSIIAMLLGFFVLVSWYLNVPILTKASADWNPMQFDIVLGILLVLMGSLLALVVGLSFSAWRKNENLQKNLKAETDRRKKVERDLDRAQEISKTGSWVLELLDQKMRWSNEVCRILDYSPKNNEMNFQRFIEFVHKDDRNFVEDEIQKAISLVTSFNITHRIVRRDGSVRMVKQRSEIYLDRKGKPTQIQGTLQDVTIQKEAENLAARLGRIVDKSFNEIYIFDAETLKFTKVNLAARLNLRYNMEELCEMTPMDLLSEYTPEKFKKLIASLNRGNESSIAFETVLKKKNGNLYPVDIRLQLSRNEARPQFVAIVEDIADRRKLESLFNKTHQDVDKQIYERTENLIKLNEELKNEIDEKKMAIEILEASENRLIEIINNVVEGIITIDEEGIIHSFNRAAEHLFGYTINEVLGENIDILIVGEEGVRSGEHFKNLTQSEKSAAMMGLRYEIRARKKDGMVFSAELAVSETVIEGQRLYTGLIRHLAKNYGLETELREDRILR